MAITFGPRALMPLAALALTLGPGGGFVDRAAAGELANRIGEPP